MTHTITALFDDRKDAEAAKVRLIQSRVDADHIQIHDKTSAGYNETGRSTHQERGIWASIKNAFLPDEDRHTYEEGVRRGGVLLTADVDDDALAEAVRVLEEADTIDIDERARDWRSSGWDYAPAATGGTASATTTDVASGYETAAVESGAGVVPATYGRRDLDRGGVRARSYSGGGSPAAHDAGTRAAGLANEAIGNVKQAAGNLFGNDGMKRDGEAQERKGEAQQGKAPDKGY